MNRFEMLKLEKEIVGSEYTTPFIVQTNALGISGECAEVMEIITYRDADDMYRENLKEEMGDLLWYVVSMMNVIKEPTIGEDEVHNIINKMYNENLVCLWGCTKLTSISMALHAGRISDIVKKIYYSKKKTFEEAKDDIYHNCEMLLDIMCRIANTYDINMAVLLGDCCEKVKKNNNYEGDVK